jgi:hypothetical protein
MCRESRSITSYKKVRRSIVRKRLLSILIVFAVLAVPCGSSFADSGPQKQGNPPSFETSSMDLMRMDKFFSGGNGKPVIFDAQAASAAGFSSESISLAQEMARFTNDLMATSKSDASKSDAMNIPSAQVESKYPRLGAFFNSASASAKQQSSSKDVAAPDKDGMSPNFGDNFATYYYCGSFVWPRPSSAAPWKTYNSSNPAATLRSWGYHETPSSAGGGWTRDQTYSWSLCGFNTYRDQALINSGNKSFREQNYAGYTPRGEPNPELWRVGPWPYVTWPAYAYWWHRTY